MDTGEDDERHQTLYLKLTILIPTLPHVPEYAKSQGPGFMDLNLDLLSYNGAIITVALSHYYEQNGDLIADPDMVIRIDTKTETVAALSYQDTYTYREVYQEGNGVDVKAKKELNEFLLQWLTNLIDQGHLLLRETQNRWIVGVSVQLGIRSACP